MGSISFFLPTRPRPYSFPRWPIYPILYRSILSDPSPNLSGSLYLPVWGIQPPLFFFLSSSSSSSPFRWCACRPGIPRLLDQWATVLAGPDGCIGTRLFSSSSWLAFSPITELSLDAPNWGRKLLFVFVFHLNNRSTYRMWKQGQQQNKIEFTRERGKLCCIFFYVCTRRRVIWIDWSRRRRLVVLKLYCTSSSHLFLSSPLKIPW